MKRILYTGAVLILAAGFLGGCGEKKPEEVVISTGSQAVSSEAAVSSETAVSSEQTVANVAPQAVSQAEEAVSAAESAIEEAAGAVESTAEEAAAAVESTAEEAAGTAESLAEEALSTAESLAEETQSLAEDVLSTAESVAEDVLSVAESLPEEPEEPEMDPNDLSLYVGLSFDDLKAAFPDVVESPTSVGANGYSLGEKDEKGTGYEVGFTGNQAADIITKAIIHFGNTYNIFGVTCGMDLKEATALPERVGLEAKSDGSNGLYVFTDPTGSELQIYSEDQETVTTVTYSIPVAG